jgi:hypothetical protein
MKRLNEIIQADNNIHASIHSDNVAQSTGDVAGDFGSGGVFESEDTEYPHDAIHDRLKGHYNKYTKTDLARVETYVGHSKLINGYHWNKAKNPNYNPYGNSVGGEERVKQLEDNTKAMDAMVSRHKTPEDPTVYSGTKHDPRKIKKNGVVNHPAYLSTSLDPQIASVFAAKNLQLDNKKREIHRHILQIHVPQGTSGAYVAHTEKALSWEKEFILPRNTKLKHIRTETSKEYPDAFEDSFPMPYKHIRHIHHMEVVP